MNLKAIPYLLILGLLLFILLQNRGCVEGKSPADEIKRDTVIRYITVRDTITKVKLIPVKVKPDTIWRNRPKNKPDTSYQGLLKQYTFLGNKYFESKFYSDTLKIKTYGNIILNDTIKANSLVYRQLITNLLIPEKTITETKLKSYRQVYLGGGIIGSPIYPIKGVYGSGIFKTKKDYLYEVGIGFDGGFIYQASIHGPLRVK